MSKVGDVKGKQTVPVEWTDATVEHVSIVDSRWLEGAIRRHHLGGFSPRRRVTRAGENLWNVKQAFAQIS